MFFTYILPAFILLSAVVDDLRSKKIHNKLILFLLALALVSFLAKERSFQALLFGLLNVLMALSISIPLVLLKVIGGGDMKLYAVMGLILSPRALLMSLICAFFWGAIFGVVKTLLDKRVGIMYMNFLSLLKLKKPSSDTLNSFPFSVSLFLGWLSAFYFL